jgi:transposase
MPALTVLAGVNRTQIPGISEVTALALLSEIGTEVSLWWSAKHFAAWMNLVPNTKQSGGKILSSRMMRKKNRAGQLLRQAASPLMSSKSSLGDYYRRRRAKLGAKGAVVATAHKMARIIYAMLLTKKPYNDLRLVEDSAQLRERQIQKYEKKLAILRAKNAA